MSDGRSAGVRSGTGGSESAGARGGLLRRHRDFRLLWCGETAGKFGVSVTGVAMPLVAVSTLHAGTLQVSVLAAAAWLPWLALILYFSPVGRCRDLPVARKG